MQLNSSRTHSPRGTTLFVCLLAAACGDSATGNPDGGAGTGGGTATGGGSAVGGGAAAGGGSSTGGGTATGGGDTSASAPTVHATAPLSAGTGVPLNGNFSATFSLPMDSTSLATSFTVSSAAGAVAGSVITVGAKAVFWPAAALPANTLLTATIGIGAKSAAGVHLASAYVWTFTTATGAIAIAPVALGGAGAFVILAKTGISTVPGSAITGDIGVSPAPQTYLTGFSLMADATNVFSTSTQLVGKAYASDDAVPTPATLTTAVGAMETAFTDAAGRAAGVSELGAGNIGGKTLSAGVYQWGTGLLIPTDLTLDGSATDVWILQVAGDLTVSNGVALHLTGGALAKNVFWQVSGAVHVGTTAHLAGVVLCQTMISMGTGASLSGRLLAQTAVSLDSNGVTQPAP